MLKKIIVATALLAFTASSQDFNSQIKTRQDAFENIEDALEVAEELAEESAKNWSELARTSRKLSNLGHTLLSAFPKGSHNDSRAEVEIWEQPEKFNRLLSQLNSGFDTMKKASEQQDVQLLEQGIEQAESTCKSCHKSYRSFW